MAYVSLLSLIPSLAAIFAVLSLFSPLLQQDSNIIAELKRFLLEHLAAGSGEQAIGYMEDFISNLDIQKIGITGFAGTLVTLILLLKQIELALNRIFFIRESRNLITRFINFWTFTTLGAFSLALFFGTLSNYDSSGVNQIAEVLSNWANKIIMVILFTLLYKVIPNCHVKTKAALLGGLFSTVLLNISGKIFSSYVVLFSNYEVVYGAALAAIPTFLLWLYIIWLIVLLGAVLTWRVHMGFSSSLNDSLTKNLYSQKEEIFARFHLPGIVVFRVCQDFYANRGQGTHIESISTEIGLPPSWVQQTVLDLIEDNILIRSDDSKSEHIHIAIPPDQLAIEEYAKALGNEPLKDRFKGQLVDMLTRIESSHTTGAKTFRDLIKPSET